MYSSTDINVKLVEIMMHNIDAEQTKIDCDELTCEKQNRLGLVTINSPKNRNAINVSMRKKLIATYQQWVEDPDIYTIIIESNNESFFSSGADVKEVLEASKISNKAALDCFRDEYETIWAIECYTKPLIALINGTVMGGGVGISQYGTHIVAGENYSWSMPEVKIGLFPDVATSQILAKMPGAIGTYLGLTGTEVNRDDAFYLGLLEFCIDAEKFEAIRDAIREAEPVDRFLDDMKQTPSPSEIEAIEPVITQVFSKNTIEEIFAELEQVVENQPEYKEWATATLVKMKEACPLSLKVTLKAIQQSKDFTVDQAFVQDFTLAYHFIEDGDFLSAVEAKLIHKTEPTWQPANIEEVTTEMVDRFFIDLNEDKLNLPSREFGVDK